MRAATILLAALICHSGATSPHPAASCPGEPHPQDSRAAPSWAVVIERAPDPAIVIRPELRAAIEKTLLPWRVRHKASGIELVLVPPGTYVRGKSPGDTLAGKWEIPAHQVTLTKPRYVGRHEVTNSQFMLFDKQHDSGRLENGTPLTADDHPVVCVAWKDCKGFCDKFGLRLLTDAEWEWACRAGATTRYPWGDDPDGGKGFGNVGDKNAWRPTNLPVEYFSWDDGMKFSAPVGSFAPNGFGIFDMIGNASEWVADHLDEKEYEHYGSGVRDPRGPERGAKCIIRGGNWLCGPKDCRVSFRNANYLATKQDRNFFVGFRIAADP